MKLPTATGVALEDEFVATVGVLPIMTWPLDGPDDADNNDGEPARLRHRTDPVSFKVVRAWHDEPLFHPGLYCTSPINGRLTTS